MELYSDSSVYAYLDANKPILLRLGQASGGPLIDFPTLVPCWEPRTSWGRTKQLLPVPAKKMQDKRACSWNFDPNLEVMHLSLLLR